jgi:hypothetical protein
MFDRVKLPGQRHPIEEIIARGAPNRESNAPVKPSSTDNSGSTTEMGITEQSGTTKLTGSTSLSDITNKNGTTIKRGSTGQTGTTCLGRTHLKFLK